MTYSKYAAAMLLLILWSGAASSQTDPVTDATAWAAFRGDGTSLSQVKNLPTVWDDTKNIAWTLDLPGYGQSSPIVWGDQIFVTTIQGETKDVPTIIAVGLDSGKQLWRQEYQASQKIKATDYVTRSSPTPAVDEQGVYALFESGDLIATDHDGKLNWQRSLVDQYGEFKGNHGIGSSLAIDADAVYVLIAHEGPSYLLAVDKKTGENLWKTDLESKVAWSSPTIADGQLILSVSGTVQAFDCKTGKRIWSVDETKGNTVASATVHGNVAFIGSSERGQNFAVEFDATGKSDATKIVWTNNDATSSFGSPLYRDGQVYYVNKQGVAICVDATTGKTTWQQRLSGSCWASPIGTPDYVYFFSKEGIADVLVPGPEPRLQTPNKLTVKDRIYGVAVAGPRFIVRTGTRLICIRNAETGNAVER